MYGIIITLKGGRKVNYENTSDSFNMLLEAKTPGSPEVSIIIVT
jgi:hypothetical protein